MPFVMSRIVWKVYVSETCSYFVSLHFSSWIASPRPTDSLQTHEIKNGFRFDQHHSIL